MPWSRLFILSIIAGLTLITLFGTSSGQIFQIDVSHAARDEVTGPSFQTKRLIESLQPKQRPRILLGIASMDFDSFSSRQFRRLIRNTYLKWSGDGRFNSSENIACMLDDITAFSPQSEFCQLVYFFIAPAVGSMENRSLEHRSAILFFSNDGLKPAYSSLMMNWFQWASKLCETKLAGKIDYIAFANSTTAILPTQFWTKNDVLMQYQPSIFAGGVAQHYKKSCDSLHCLGNDFLLVSRDIAERLQRESANLLLNDDTLALAGLLAHLNHCQEGACMKNNVTIVSLSGVEIVGDCAHAFLEHWNEYVWNDANYFTKEIDAEPRSRFQHVKSYNGSARILFGIFTSDSPVEQERRDSIRETYLRTFVGTLTPNRICSLQDLLEKKVEEDECQFAYTFVFGANPYAPPLLTNSTSSREMEMDYVKGQEADSVYLQKQLHFDYVGKMDSDTMLFPQVFLHRLSNLPLFPANNRVWGGKAIVKEDTKDSVVGAAYMAGQFYWLSPDLAEFISQNCPRKAYSSEDRTVGNCVNSHPLPIRRVLASTHDFIHPVKKPAKFRVCWKNTPAPCLRIHRRRSKRIFEIMPACQ